MSKKSDLTKMNIPRGSSGSEFISVPDVRLGDIAKVWKIGVGAGRTIAAERIKADLTARGYDPLTISAAVAAVKNGDDPAGIIAAADEAAAARQRTAELKRNPPPVHGSASWADADQMAEAGLLYEEEPETGHGLLLGTVDDEYLYWAGESHLLTVAPTRTGKATMQIIPNLLRYRGSTVVLDPKGELAAATAGWRAANVGPVHVLDPFGIGPADQPTAAYNPLDFVENERDATKLAEMVYPRAPNQTNPFFDHEAIGFLSAVILFCAKYAPDAFRSLGTIRDTLASLDEAFFGLLDAMSRPHLPPSIRNAANNVKTKSFETGKPRLLDSLNQHLRIWDTPGLRAATARTDFDFRTLKERPTTVYLLLPFDEITTYSTYAKLIFAAALDAMLMNPTKPDIPVLFILDEFLALEPDDRFVSALRTHAGSGCRLWFFLQDLPTLEQKYPNTWKSFLQVEAKTFFGTDDPFTAELVSKFLGDKTVAYTTSASSPSVTNNSASYSINESVQLTGRPLLTPVEIMGALTTHDARQPRTAIHRLRGVPPIQATLTPWFDDPVALARVQEQAHVQN